MAVSYRDMPIEKMPKLKSKPENMTHLFGNELVKKTHPRISFRGMLDSLCAHVITLQVLCDKENEIELLSNLEEVLLFVRKILSLEVQNKPLDSFSLFGLDSDALRYESHHIKELYGINHPLPEYSMGEICAKLNELRTFVRQTELSASCAFEKNGTCEREDIVMALNRLSSAIYILFIRQLTGKKPIIPLKSAPLISEKKGFMVEASGRHVHLTEDAVMALFGEPLHKKSDLSQPGQYACEERLTIMTNKGEIERVVVLGPPRKEVQVEMSLTDARILGIDIPVNLSGDLKGAGDVILVGPNGIYNAPGSAIAAKAHIHMTTKDAEYYGVKDCESVSVRLMTKRPVTVDDVIVRVNDDFSLAMHIDYDEANACSYVNGDLGYIVTKGEKTMDEALIKKVTEEVVKELEKLLCKDSTTTCCSQNITTTSCDIEVKVLTERIAKEMIKDNPKEVKIPNTTIITPAAKDVFTQNRIKIIII